MKSTKHKQPKWQGRWIAFRIIPNWNREPFKHFQEAHNSNTGIENGRRGKGRHQQKGLDWNEAKFKVTIRTNTFAQANLHNQNWNNADQQEAKSNKTEANHTEYQVANFSTEM